LVWWKNAVSSLPYDCSRNARSRCRAKGPILTWVYHIHDRRVLPNNRTHMKPPMIHRTLHTCDLDLYPEAHVHLLLARMSRDLRVMYEPPDLSTPEAAAESAVRFDRLLATLESHHRAIKALRNPLQEKKCRVGLGLLDGRQRNSVTELVTVLDS